MTQGESCTLALVALPLGEMMQPAAYVDGFAGTNFPTFAQVT